MARIDLVSIAIVAPEPMQSRIAAVFEFDVAPRLVPSRYTVTAVSSEWFELYREDHLLSSATTPGALRHTLYEDLQSQITSAVADRALVHAGVVALQDRLVVIPGSSHSGKTTLVAALLDLGATYYSDEQAIIDVSGYVEPFPRPLVLRDPSCLPEHRSDYTVGTEPLHPDLVLLTRYHCDAGWAPRPVSESEALMLVLQHSLTIRSRPSVTMRAVRNMVAGAVCLEGPRGDAREAALQVAELLSQ